ncbi:MAG: HNH endonuclease, partial [Erythrobacter sp.]|nr:HNH endonuclease [Erythrobacter sp.]
MSDHPNCWLCSRPLGDIEQWHHPVPKAKKGKVKVPIHPICHKTI